MNEFLALKEALILLFSWPVIGFAIAGILLGIIIGAIPGIGPAIGMTVLLPLTVVLESTAAIILLVCVYMGGMYGGSISAILLNVPGTAGSAASTFDGYPLSRQGRAINALAISATASAIGGLIAVAVLFITAPFIIDIVLAFESPHFFLIALLGLAMITVVARGSMVKGLTAGMVGLLYASVGIAPTAAQTRYDFGMMALYDGLHLIAAILGLFAIAEMIKLGGEQGGIAKNKVELEGSVREGIQSVRKHPVTTIKSGILGTAIGSLPGAGSSMANFISYSEAMRSLSDSDKFGSGDPRGVIASEASNNGAVGGSLIPTLSFGIPGSASSAILLGALVMHGLNPGPNLFGADLSITFAMYAALGLSAGVVIPIVGLLIVTRAGYITKVNTDVIVPIIVVLSCVGVYSLRVEWVDVATVVIVGLVGYFMVKHGYSIIAFLLGVILGRIAEENLFRSLQLSEGSYAIFADGPISITLLAMIVAVLVSPVVMPRIKAFRDAN